MNPRERQGDTAALWKAVAELLARGSQIAGIVLALTGAAVGIPSLERHGLVVAVIGIAWVLGVTEHSHP